MHEHNIDIANILFLDIETVSGKPDYENLSEDFQELWQIKARQLSRNDGEEEPDYAALYKERAAIFAEFGKIVCISVGVVYRDKEDQLLKVRLKSFASENEKELLYEFPNGIQILQRPQ